MNKCFIVQDRDEDDKQSLKVFRTEDAEKMLNYLVKTKGAYTDPNSENKELFGQIMDGNYEGFTGSLYTACVLTKEGYFNIYLGSVHPSS